MFFYNFKAWYNSQFSFSERYDSMEAIEYARMSFDSVAFFIFFPITTLGYFILPHRFRWLWLLVASCAFYMAFIPSYILILFATIVVDYIAGLWIEKSVGRRRKIFLIISLVSNISFLAFFKYYNFTALNFTALAHALHWNYTIPLLKIILPIGLSFHTFQAMSYTIEVYRGHQPAERHFGLYALYVLFYPQLVAGPIERPQHMLPQFREVHRFDAGKVSAGLRRMLWGFFKKIVVADRLAVIVTTVYGNVHGYAGIPLVIATIAFAFQIYGDFSGYSDIARGSAEVMGFRLMKNFERPYFSKSIAEFWRRWHISLSSWFRDYVYLPLGGNRVGAWRSAMAIAVVFLLSGLWHGANWTFVVWGVWHAGCIIISRLTRSLRQRLVGVLRLDRFPRAHAFLKVSSTFALVCFGWIWFRAATLSDAWYVTTHLGSGIGQTLGALFTQGKSMIFAETFLGFRLGLDRVEFLIAIMVVAVLLGAEFLIRNPRGWFLEKYQHSVVLRWSIYYFLLFSILIFGMYTDTSAFIYFQF